MKGALLLYLFFLLMPMSVTNDERLLGTWIMVKATKDGVPKEDESITEKYTYTYAKNGDFIFDIRLVRKMANENRTSIVDFPRIKYQTSEGEITLRFVFPGKASMPDMAHTKAYTFHKDTLVTAIGNFQYFYLKNE